ncbi:hypothetical protein GCM10010082_14170 [Kushneria pakistanensis]|uniref:Uncharacterized protein n=1 Tax=Kushneria pakistanensis TaxID=1508770 RepID=A0ABQ3FGJ4_9GAMM|nr:hypothetical protein GCM10010082_14170 [Kushneria pakistanensis]
MAPCTTTVPTQMAIMVLKPMAWRTGDVVGDTDPAFVVSTMMGYLCGEYPELLLVIDAGIKPC